jgi:prephenate dehydrogenase
MSDSTSKPISAACDAALERPHPFLEKVAVFGVGLIGGSFALALRQAGVVGHIVGAGRRRSSLERAKELGIIDSIAETAAEAVSNASLVLIAAPVAQTGALLEAIGPHLSTDTVVTDAGSTKADVVAAARAALGQRVCQFVPGHPIAGRELTGPDAALATLFQGKKTVLTPLAENGAEHVARVADAWRNCGAVIHSLPPEEHDRVFASVSHLPHLLAYALVDDISQKPNADLLFQYAASGFRDFTRIAGSSPEMWRDITLANRTALLNELQSYQSQLERLHTLLQAGDGAAIEALYANAQRAREKWLRSIEAADGSQCKKDIL